MNSYITEAQVLELLAFCNGIDNGQKEVEMTRRLCGSWLQQNEELRWIPVSQAPDHASRVLVLHGLSISVARYMDGEWHVAGMPSCADVAISHWREIGPLPKEGE